MSLDARWNALIAAHGTAIGEFLARAESLPEAQWHVPRAEGKWTPAQETMHLVLSYAQFTKELRGGAGMAYRLPRYKRIIARYFFLPAMLRSGRIREGVRAPRELRPAEDPGAVATERAADVSRTELIARLRNNVAEFERTVAETVSSGNGRRVTHPFFGKLPMDTGMRFVTLHARHHLAHLPVG